MKKPHIEYPCWWTYAIIGAGEENLRLAAAEVARGAPHRASFSKLSAQKSFASLHVEIRVSSDEERLRFFNAFKVHRQVRFVL